MNLIFNELKYAENLLTEHNEKIKVADLFILAKYFRHLGKNNSQIKKDLIDYCLQHDSSFNVDLSSKMINSVLNKSKKYQLRIVESVLVTQKEIEKIKTLNDYKCEKILFTMLVLSLVKGEKPDGKNYYVNESFYRVVKLAKIATINKAERNALMFKINSSGLAVATLYGSFKVNFVDREDKTNSIIVDDFDNIGNFYHIYCECGNMIEKNSYKKSICSKCYKEERKRMKNEYIKNVRMKNNQ